MKYTASPKKLKKQLGSWFKTAVDLAKLLDDPKFAVSGDKYSIRSSAESRLKIFDRYCAVLTLAQVPVPALEPELYLTFSKSEPEKGDKERAEKVASFVQSELQGKKTAAHDPCLAILSVM